MTLEECRTNIIERLRRIYPQGESSWMARIIFEQLKGYSQVDLVMKADTEISDYIAAKVDSVVDRLLRHEPIQYIFGETQFYGIRLKVTPATLIPRPETEELVEMIVRDADGRRDLQVLDICTGSGCIAIALARNLSFPSIEAIDISTDALEVARENSQLTRTHISFSEADALHLSLRPCSYDIIVSNPPYIAESERADMEANVLDYEPAVALFVPDSDPLRFYKAIAHASQNALKPGGRLYFEINPKYARELSDSLKSSGWSDVTLQRDSRGLYRFLSASRQ